MKTREQALRDLGMVIAEEAATLRTLTPEQAAVRAWSPDRPPLDVLTEQIRATGLCAA